MCSNNDFSKSKEHILKTPLRIKCLILNLMLQHLLKYEISYHTHKYKIVILTSNIFKQKINKNKSSLDLLNKKSLKIQEKTCTVVHTNKIWE